MTPGQREQYERAAVALENGENLPRLAELAFNRVASGWGPGNGGITSIRHEAARLLRECLARNEVLR